MPRDPSGNYSLPALGNPAVTNTPITIAWWNGTGTDLASAMTDSLSRTGSGGMLGPFGAVDGTAGAPGLTFQSETTTGFYRPSSGEMDVVVGTARVSRWTSGGFQGTVDGGANWKFPIYQNLAGQSITSGTVDWTAGTILVGGIALRAGGAPVITKSSSTGSFSSSGSAVYVAVTNANLTFTANGSPVLVTLVADDTSSAAFVDAIPNSGTATPKISGLLMALSADGGSTFFAQQSLATIALYNGVIYQSNSFAPSCFAALYTPAAGAGKTIGLYVESGAANLCRVLNCKLAIAQF